MALPPQVPADLLGHYAPRREITFSLKTSSYPEAVEKARKEAVRLDQEFARVRARAEARSIISEDEVNRLVQAYRHESLAADEMARLQGTQDADLHEAVRAKAEPLGGVANHDPVEVMRHSLDAFRRGDIKFAAVLDCLWAQMHDLPQLAPSILGEMEDAWTEMEIIYAKASARQQRVLSFREASELEVAIDRFLEVLEKAR